MRKIRRLEATVENLKLQLDLKGSPYHEAKSELKVIKIDQISFSKAITIVEMSKPKVLMQ